MKADELKEDKKVALVAILGVTPAVLTEAVWALAHPQEGEPVVPDEILVLTTGTGERVLKNTIGTHLARGGVWSSLKKDLAAEGLDTKGKLIVKVELFRDANGNLLEDLPTQEANLQAADKMMKEIRDYTDDEGWIVYGLLAGGRKTMSALFFSCMCLLGRRCDRIYHVLASEGYDARLDPPFCYPQKGVLHHEMECVAGKWRRKPKGRALHSENCKVNLFAVPFAYMGEWCQQKCKGRRLSYGSLIKAVNKSLDDAMLPEVIVDFWDGEVMVDGTACKLAEAEFALFVYLAQGMDSKIALASLDDLQQYLEDVGSGLLPKCGRWLSDFSDKDSKMFYKPQFKDEKERQRQIKGDLIHVKNRMKKKLPTAVFDLLFKAGVTKDKVVWTNMGTTPPDVLDRFFTSGVPEFVQIGN